MGHDSAKWLIAGWIGGLLSVGLVGLAVAGLVLSGLVYDTSATKGHSRLFAWAVHQTMINSVRHRARPVPQLAAASPALVLKGAAEYEAHCIACHGGPGVNRADWVSGMLPTPPFLIDAPTRWSPAELHHLIKHGVKMTGMPAWGVSEPEDRIDAIVAFLEAMPRLTAPAFAQIRQHIGPVGSDVPLASHHP